MSAYRRGLSCLSFLIKDDELLEKFDEIWEVRNSTKKEFDSEPVYNENI